MGAAEDYYSRTIALLQDLRDTQMDHIDQAAEICTESIANGGLVFLFGAEWARDLVQGQSELLGPPVFDLPHVEPSDIDTPLAEQGGDGSQNPRFVSVPGEEKVPLWDKVHAKSPEADEAGLSLEDRSGDAERCT